MSRNEININFDNFTKPEEKNVLADTSRQIWSAATWNTNSKQKAANYPEEINMGCFDKLYGQHTLPKPGEANYPTYTGPLDKYDPKYDTAAVQNSSASQNSIKIEVPPPKKEQLW